MSSLRNISKTSKRGQKENRKSNPNVLNSTILMIQKIVVFRDILAYNQDIIDLKYRVTQECRIIGIMKQVVNPYNILSIVDNLFGDTELGKKKKTI